jgi:hypothetical protein
VRCRGRRSQSITRPDGGRLSVHGHRMTPASFRKPALSLPEAHKSSHINQPDFRVGKRVFATLGHPGCELGNGQAGTAATVTIPLGVPGDIRPGWRGLGARRRDRCEPALRDADGAAARDIRGLEKRGAGRRRRQARQAAEMTGRCRRIAGQWCGAANSSAHCRRARAKLPEHHRRVSCRACTDRVLHHRSICRGTGCSRVPTMPPSAGASAPPWISATCCTVRRRRHSMARA